jgi:hypothetical protein
LKNFFTEIEESPNSYIGKNIHILIKYLHETQAAGVVEMLIRILKEESMSNLDLYLPQLCYLVITKRNLECVNKLKKFIVEISISNSNIGLRSLHYFHAWSDDDLTSIPYVQ